MKQQTENTTLQVGSIYQFRDGTINLFENKSDEVLNYCKFMKPKMMILNIDSSSWWARGRRRSENQMRVYKVLVDDKIFYMRLFDESCKKFTKLT